MPDVGMVMSSPFTRAWQTAEILRSEAGWAAPRRLDLLSADRPASAVLAGIWEVLPALDVGAAGEPGTRDRSASRASLALVGHEPQLGELAALLIGSSERAAVVFKKGSIACFEVPAGEAAAEGASTGLAGTGQLLWLAPPKLLRALAR
jgi:phosphohistidine phosphatase